MMAAALPVVSFAASEIPVTKDTATVQTVQADTNKVNRNDLTYRISSTATPEQNRALRSVASKVDRDAVEVVAAFLNNMTKKDASDVPVKITPEKPLPRRKKGRRNGNYRRGNDNFKRSKRFNKHDRNNRDNKRRSGKKNRFTIRTKKA